MLAAWLVHLFTASGLLAGFMGLLAVADGDYRAAMGWLFLTLVIDGIDGTFARMARVGERLPHVSGKTIDYVIDFFTYAILPAYLFYEAVDMDYWPRLLCCFAMLLSAAIYYGIEGMVSEDGRHFVGFPVLWNMVVYVVVFVVPEWAPATIVALVAFFTVLHFVPVLIPYPSKGGTLFPVTLAAVVGFIVAAGFNIWYYPEPSLLWRLVTLLCVLWLAAVTVYDTIKARG